MNHLMHQSYKSKQLNNTQKNRALKVKNSPLELEEYFKPITISIDDMYKLEEKEIMKKRTITKNTWYDWYNYLMNYILRPIKKSWVVLKTIL